MRVEFEYRYGAFPGDYVGHLKEAKVLQGLGQQSDPSDSSFTRYG